MGIQSARENVANAMRLVFKAFVESGYIDVPSIKRRDRREPGKKQKEEAEDRLYRLVRRLFRLQAERIRTKLELIHPSRKAIGDVDLSLFDDAFDDDKLSAELLRLLQNATRDGVALFGKQSRVQIDWSLTNQRAADWARDYTFDLVKNINDTTRDMLRQTVNQFVETPGMTIGDVMNTLPFDELRAEMVAITEITRAYAQGNQLAGEDLREEFPDVRVIKIWFTNNDEIVCPICLPLDGKEAEINGAFKHPETGEEYDNPPAHPRCRCWTETTTALAEL